jgi:hypothetical protein
MYTDNIAKVGHRLRPTTCSTYGAHRAGRIEEGDYLLLFTFGYGSTGPV